MKAKSARNKKGQGLLETALSLIVVILFLGGIIHIWFWANRQIVRRQVRYNATRVQAGTARDGYRLAWPVYTPQTLTEGEVFTGR